MNLTALAQPVRSSRPLAYLAALVLTAVGAGANILFASTLQSLPLVMAMMMVTASAFLGGRGPAVLAAVLSAIFAQYYFILPGNGYALTSSVYIGFVFYVCLCAVIIVPVHGMVTANAALQASRDSLTRLNDQLEQRIAERTATLVEAQKQLRATNQNLEGLVEARVGDLRVANEEIQRFAYIVSHDLRAPLVNVLGFTSELDALRVDLVGFMAEVGRTAPALVTPERRLAVETDFPEALAFIRSSTQKMDRLINAILKLSRDGRRRLMPEAIDVADLLRAQGESLAQQFAARDAELVIGEGLPDLVSDRLAVEQIFGNLIENAVKYLRPDRPGRIEVTARPTGSHLAYDVADNGRGIAAKDFERIFDLFRRSGEQDTPGEGIGLATVRNLVRRLGGEVTVRSDIGVGSVFTVALPAAFPVRSREDLLETAG